GPTWIAWLNDHGGGAAFDKVAAELLGNEVYRVKHGDLPGPEHLRMLLEVAQAWIQSHRSEPVAGRSVP
ncbi:MAG: hypothetical protein JSW46_03730, partial [Gemmatimonadota bacterium]